MLRRKSLARRPQGHTAKKKNARRGMSHAAHCQPDFVAHFFGNVIR